MNHQPADRISRRGTSEKKYVVIAEDGYIKDVGMFKIRGPKVGPFGIIRKQVAEIWWAQGCEARDRMYTRAQALQVARKIAGFLNDGGAD